MPGAFKLDHLNPGKPNFFFINFQTLILHTGEPNSYCPRDRLKMRKGNSQNIDETQWFRYIGHSNRTVCSLLSQFCYKSLQIFTFMLWAHFFLPQRAEN